MGIECFSTDVQCCLVDALLDVGSDSVLSLSKTCHTFAATIERWLAAKRVGCRLFSAFSVSRKEVSYLLARPYLRWAVPLSCWRRGCFLT
jgi:hypothetical protein